MNEIIRKIEEAELKSGITEFNVGDTIRVYAKIKEGNRERIQMFEGTVLKRQGGGARETFTVRTDIVDGVTRRYTCYSNNRVLHYILRRRNGTEYVKVSFPIIEM